MFEAAHSTAPIRLRGLPQRSSASCAAFTAISARIEISSFGRSGMTGRITAGSRMPDFCTTKRDLMPEAFSMNSAEEGGIASTRPSAMAAAFSALNRSA